MRIAFPFTAIVGQDDMKLAMLIAATDPGIGGVMVFGDRGTGKSTAVRGLAALLPPIKMVKACQYHCDPRADKSSCATGCVHRLDGGIPDVGEMATPVVDFPLGATEDRVVGALDLERALTQGEKHFEPGLLARANRGFLYIDEVNLLDDHLVDLLLDVAASGENVVEREGLSVRHPARFVLIGSGNPEEGELRPQLLDRFGLSVDVKTPDELAVRVEVVPAPLLPSKATQRWKTIICAASPSWPFATVCAVTHSMKPARPPGLNAPCQTCLDHDRRGASRNCALRRLAGSPVDRHLICDGPPWFGRYLDQGSRQPIF